MSPRAAWLGPSSRASQHATPNESNAAPATRPTISAAGESSDAPSNNPVTNDGEAINVTPSGASANAVTVNRFLVAIRMPKRKTRASRVACERRVEPGTSIAELRRQH